MSDSYQGACLAVDRTCQNIVGADESISKGYTYSNSVAGNQISYIQPHKS